MIYDIDDAPMNQMVHQRTTGASTNDWDEEYG